EFVTLRQLREEVGSDAARFFYVMRGHDQHLDFDLDLARAQSNDNPVYYVQYAHARVASLFRQLAERRLAWHRAAGEAARERLRSPHERLLLLRLLQYPEAVETAALRRAPQLVANALRETAQAFHSWYNAEPILVEDAELRNARLALAQATGQVLASGLALLGVSAPDRM
ncbi:MAG: DALR anticodon-binding domain-containing protein, partial [Gaiellaceae bacterium]|nr:DALR anticodon-binding domain-containing protein [Gaiellaceae bacterium]